MVEFVTGNRDKKREGVRPVGESADLLLDGVGRDAPRRVAVGAIDYPVIAEPEQGIVVCGDGKRRRAASFDERPGNPLEREIRVARIEVDFDSLLAEDPQFAVIREHGHHLIRVAFGIGEVGGDPGGPVIKRRDEELAGARLVDHEIAVLKSHRVGGR